MPVTVSAISNGSLVSSIHARLFLSVVFLLTAYKNGEGRALLEGQHLSHELQTIHSRPIFCEHRESERAGLQNRCPQRYTCTGVWAIRFLGSVFATAHVICSSRRCVYILLFIVFLGRRVLLLFFPAIVRGTARRTSSCIDFVWLHRTNTQDVSCEWSH
jgi:hypothetical protein